MTEIKGIIIDPLNRKRFKGKLIVENGKILSITQTDTAPDQYILPGFVDAHIHIESSMLVPSEFARLAVQHGTVATISDPHEIANVCGLDGVEFMIENGKSVPLKFHFGAPSCVPATTFETAGARLDVDDVTKLLERDDIFYLAEMMNWPGVLFDDEEVLAKIKAAQKIGKPVDGHAPGLKGEQAKKYCEAGITTDHECFTLDEALDKLKHGMNIIIREGSAAKNFDALIPLFSSHPGKLMFGSDDKHPDDLLLGHINSVVSRAINLGYDFFDVLHAACVLPVQHYKMNVGLLQPGHSADFIIVDNLDTMHVSQTWIEGACVFDGNVLFEKTGVTPINYFVDWQTIPSDFQVKASGNTKNIPVIDALDGELITKRSEATLQVENNLVLSDQANDILKITVVNRYAKVPPAVGFIRNFGLKNGAIASSVGHDSHNIIAVGSSDEYLSKVVNLIMDAKGGIAAVHEKDSKLLPLPVAGIMTHLDGTQAGKDYEALNNMAKAMGSTLGAPFMLISFMALLVIPSIKMSDKGLFDAERFEFISF